MATTLTAQTMDRGGLDLSGAVAADATGNNWANTGVEFLFIVNGGGGSITVTLDIQPTVDGQAVTDRTVSVAAGARKLIGPFPTNYYNDANSRANVSFSGVSSVSVMVIKPTTT